MTLEASLEQWIDTTISSMGVDEKATLTTGGGIWETAPSVPLGLRAIRVSDGPNGVRGQSFDERDVAYCTPCGTALAATWDQSMVRRIGELVGRDAHRKGIDVVLGPTVNMHRSPLGGRGFECFSEDPRLTSHIAVAWVEGVQSTGVGATAKHFVANDSETSRRTADMVVGERALRELYLVPFEALAAHGVYAVMTAYNKVNGTYASEQSDLVGAVLKDEWGWDGLVVSDWFGTNDAMGCALGRLDLEMPGPGQHLGASLGELVEAGRVEEKLLDDKVRRLARLAYRIGALECSPPQSPRSDPGDGAERLVLREAAAAGMVLMRNDQSLLPLDPNALRRVAVIGPAATRAVLQGGGSAQVAIGATTSPLDALRHRLGGVEIVHEIGCLSDTALAPLSTLPTFPVDDEGAAAGAPGITVEYFDTATCDGVPRMVEVRRTGQLVWLGDFPLRDQGLATAGIKLRGTFVVEEDGDYEFSVRGGGRIRLSIDGTDVLEQPFQDFRDDPFAMLMSREDTRCRVGLRAGTRHLEVTAELDVWPLMVVEAGGRRCLPAGTIDAAARTAADADVAIVVVGNTQDDESESNDRKTVALPGEQAALVEAVAAANPRTVVVVNAGMAVDLTCARNASALLYGWFGGQEMGPALADVLVGEREPAGRLPFTIADHPGDYPVYSTKPDAETRVHYDESIFIGYRHFDTRGIEPAFCFGHGLGYGDPVYRDLVATGTVFGEETRVTVVVENAGARPTKEVVQLYVSELAPDVSRPVQELAALAAVHLEPGQTETVGLSVPPRAFSYWDEAGHRWVERTGTFRLSVGRSSRDLRAAAEITRA